ncbi:MAG TPA: GNAT family N-acetyltransferase [Nocardioidaceae bacterium]|nr:GNAT family N-acetyltransferase [Nocardioidaceae bacterium]
MTIRRVDPADDAEMREYQRLYELAERAEMPDAVAYTLDDAVTVLSRPSLGSRYEGYAAFEGGRMVGEGMIVCSIEDNLDRARMWVWVPPAERNRGVGCELVEFLVDRCRELGRTVLQSTTTCPPDAGPDHPHRRFAARHGFSRANVQIERRLILPVPDERLDRLASQAAPHHRDYTLRTVVGQIPADLAQGYVGVQNQLGLDAPAGDLRVEKGRRTADGLADQDRELLAQGRTRLTVFALDAAGTVVGFTCAVPTGGEEPHVDQRGTIVRRADRGHRLGLALKVAGVREIQRRFPAKRFVSTVNAETNAPMAAVNEALGFTPYAIEDDLQRIL